MSVVVSMWLSLLLLLVFSGRSIFFVYPERVVYRFNAVSSFISIWTHLHSIICQNSNYHSRIRENRTFSSGKWCSQKRKKKLYRMFIAFHIKIGPIHTCMIKRSELECTAILWQTFIWYQLFECYLRRRRDDVSKIPYDRSIKRYSNLSYSSM